MKKQRLLLVVLFFFVFLCLVKFNIGAASGSSDDNTISYETSSVSQKSVCGFPTVLYDDYGICGQKKIHVNILQQKCDLVNNGTKIVTWAVKNATNSGFINKNVAAICMDYEKNHPGWIVTGGINADQYSTKFGNGLGVDGSHPYTNQPYYPMIGDGEKWFSNTWMDDNKGSAGRFVGLKNDGSIDPLLMINANNAETQLTLQILNENNEIVKKYLVDSFNGEGETVVYSGYYSDTSFGLFVPKNVSAEKLYIIEKAELAYCNNSSTYTNVNNSQDAFFGKGIISKIDKTCILNKGQFAISTSNIELIEELKINSKVRCQYEYINEEYNSLEAAIGFHAIQRDNNKDVEVVGSYNTNTRTRSVIGKKLNGTITLMIIDDYNDSYGTTGKGINAICKAYGISEAYQMDGGGSAQMAVRQENGTFKNVTYSADSNSTTTQRSVFSALLCVVRDPNYKQEYNVDFVSNGGLISEQMISKYTDYNDLSLPTPIKDGYVFDKWYLDSEFKTKVSKDIKGNIVLYAKYYKLGDIDRNDSINLLDCIKGRIYIATKTYNDELQDKIGDLNNDGVFNEQDIILLQEYIIK